MGLKYIILFLLIIPVVSANSIRINEVMADTQEDKYNEWIELYNYGNSEVNVSGWFIGDEYENDTIEGGKYGGSGSIIIAKGYAIITDDATRVYDNFDIYKNSTKLYVNDDAIGNGLKNSGETFYLYNKNKNLIDSFSYGATTEGFSCTIENEITCCDSIPTPGYWNNGSWLEECFIGPCDWKVNLILNETSFKEEDFEFRVDVKKVGGGKADITLIREIQDVYGNIISSYSPLTKFLTYGSNFGGPWSPNYDPGMYWIKVCIETNCNEIRLDNNCDEKLFVIEGDELSDNSTIKIDRIYDLGNDNIARFGQTIKVKLEVYKGDTSKEAVIVHIEDESGQRVSKDSKVNVEDKFTNYTLTIPVQLIPNCNEKFIDGSYVIIVKGLEDRDTEELEIAGISPDMCEIVKEYSVKESVYTEGEESESILNEGVTGNVIYEGKSEKQGEYAVYFFCFSLVTVIIYLLFKNE